MAKRHPIFIELSGVSDSSGNLTLKSKPLDPGDLLCIQRVSVLNNTTASCVAKAGVEVSGRQSWFESITMTTAGLVYAAVKEPVWVLSDYQLVVVFSSAGSAVACYAWGYGYLEELEKEGEE